MKPLKIAEGVYDWYRVFPGDAGVTHDGANRLTQHWLPGDVFNRLEGGTLLPIMGIRRYASEREALNALPDRT